MRREFSVRKWISRYFPRERRAATLIKVHRGSVSWLIVWYRCVVRVRAYIFSACHWLSSCWYPLRAILDFQVVRLRRDDPFLIKRTFDWKMVKNDPSTLPFCLILELSETRPIPTRRIYRSEMKYFGEICHKSRPNSTLKTWHLKISVS